MYGSSQCNMYWLTHYNRHTLANGYFLGELALARFPNNFLPAIILDENQCDKWCSFPARSEAHLVSKHTESTARTSHNQPGTSGYATIVHGRGCNQHRCTTTFANVEITSLWRHWRRRKSETIRDRQKRRPHRRMKSSVLYNGENRIALRQLLQKQKLRQWWRHNLSSRKKLQKMARENFSIRALYNITKN